MKSGMKRLARGRSPRYGDAGASPVVGEDGPGWRPRLAAAAGRSGVLADVGAFPDLFVVSPLQSQFASVPPFPCADFIAACGSTFFQDAVDFGFGVEDVDLDAPFELGLVTGGERREDGLVLVDAGDGFLLALAAVDVVGVDVSAEVVVYVRYPLVVRAFYVELVEFLVEIVVL